MIPEFQMLQGVFRSGFNANGILRGRGGYSGGVSEGGKGPNKT
jgi:hypothetical protein